MELRECIKTFIAVDLVGQPQLVIADNDDLLLNGLVDSLGVIRLIGFLEDQTGVNIPPGDVTIENFGTIQAMAIYLEARQAA